MIAGGVSKRTGPYLLAYRHVAPKTGVKLSVGARGSEVELMTRVKKVKLGVGVSSTVGPYGRVRYKRLSLRPSYDSIKKRKLLEIIE